VPWNKGKTGYTMPARRKISEEDYKDYQKYKRAVYSASRKTYNQHINLLNPDGLLLGRCGTPEAHQIDHKVPISIGYQLQIPVTVMAIIENLQLMTWKENLNKSNKQETNQEILNMLIEKTNYIKGLTT
jgi:5-methylcytosine-specific restriction endonuclease McrA